MRQPLEKPFTMMGSRLQIAILTGIAVVFAYLFWTAFVLQIDYFDSYGILLNAKSIAAMDGSTYHWRRAPVGPILLSPFFLTERLLSLDRFGFVASHLMSVCFFALLLLFFYRTLRLTQDRLWALSGTFLLTLNGLMIHYALSAKEDMPGTLFVTAAFYFYLRDTRKPSGRNTLLTCVFIALSIATRFNFIPLVFTIIAVHELWSGNTCLAALFKTDSAEARKRFCTKVGWFLIVPSLVFFLIPTFLYPFLGIETLLHAPKKFMDELFLQYGMAAGVQAPGQNYEFLLYSCTAPVLLMALVGLIASVRQKMAGTRLAILWIGMFFLFHTYWIGAKEARYLLPLYPALYLFAARGLEQAVRRLQTIRTPLICRFAPVVLVVVIFAWPVRQTISEAIRLRDPVYTTDFQRRVSLYAKELAGERRIIWAGPFYAIHPKDFLFHPEDEFTCLYHFYNHVVQFYTGEPVATFDGGQTVAVGSGQGPVFPGPNVAHLVREGDVLIINREPESYLSSNVPDTLRPLIIERVRLLPFIAVPQNDETPSEFVSTEFPDARLQTLITIEGYGVQGVNIPDGSYEIVLHPRKSQPSISFAITNVTGGRFRVIHKGLQHETDLSGITLLTYDSVKRFAIPVAAAKE